MSATDQDAARPRTDRPAAAGGRGRVAWRVTVVAGAIYLVAGVALWWGVWSAHPTTSTTCGCGDAARFLWFFEWPAYALTHGHSLFYSQWLFHPAGINLLNDTSVLALGIALTPVTLVFGPVAAMNVALTLAPVLSALAMFVLLRRWVQWAPAAVLGGLVFGFSPFLVTELALNQLNIAFLAIPPLVVVALDELLVRQRHSPYRVGVALAALLVVQFFVSTEVLVITVVFGLVGVVLVVGAVALRAPEEIGRRTAHALRGSLTAIVVAGAVLAYPLWFLLRGPAHLTGPIWSNGTISHFGNSPTSFWTAGSLGDLGAGMHRLGGYQGPALPGLGYLGAGVVVVALVGLVLFHRDVRLLLFGGVGAIAAALSLGTGRGYWVPWEWVERVPWVGDIVEVRFTIVLSLCAAVMVGVVVDRIRGRAIERPGMVRPLVAGVVAVILLVPTALTLGPNLPLTVRPVVLPHWYTEVGARLPPGRVLLSYPLAFSGLQSSEAWQAVNRMRYAQAGGGGPEGQVGRAGRARAGFEVLLHASIPLGPAPLPTAPALAAIRQALTIWGVTTIVVPDQPELPPYTQGRSPAYAVGLLTAAMGRPPSFAHDAWVWSGVGLRGPPVVLSAHAFASCTAGRPVSSVPGCVLGRDVRSAPHTP